jgi:hypothetical protein
LKAALIKQQLDIFGPWQGVKWKDTSPEKLFEIWPGKAVYWELTCMLQADWYIVPQQRDSEYIREAVGKHLGRAEAVRKYTTNLTAPDQIPLEAYDLVITFDAILKPAARAGTVFAYYAQEHWDRLYIESLKQPVSGYDLFLAHMMDARDEVETPPQALAFPYLHDANLVRSIFSREKQDCVWVDWRTLTTLAMMGLGDPWTEAADAAGRRLQEVLELPIVYRGKHHEQSFAFADPPQWGDAKRYFAEMARCRYYVGVGNIAGAGQGLGDAASAGCLCIGQADKAYHRLLCHPQFLCGDIAEMPDKLHALTGSTSLQTEVMEFQDRALREHFQRKPLESLEKAARMKKALGAGRWSVRR